jgi:hypothetical protein
MPVNEKRKREKEEVKKQKKESKGKGKRGGDEDKKEKDEVHSIKVVQTPQFFLPAVTSEAVNVASFPVCMRCCVPPRTDEPFVVRATESTVSLQWYNPLFDGVKPKSYRVEMKTFSRNFSDWMPLRNTGLITSPMYVIKDLPLGIAVQFRVCARNNGGWGEVSEPCAAVIPGENLAPLPTEVRWRRIVRAGVLGILDYLEVHAQNRWEHLIGFRFLLDYAQKHQGFKKGYRMKVARVTLKATGTFDIDLNILSSSFYLMGYALMAMDVPPRRRKAANQGVREYLVDGGVVKLSGKFLESHRNNPRLIGSVTWLRSNLDEVPQNPVIIYDEDKDPLDTSEEEELQKYIDEGDAAIFRALAKL